jgi:hypothetical protein
MAGSHPPPRAALVVAFRRARTQAVCMRAKVTQRWMQIGGIGSARVMRDEAAELLEPCGMHGHISRFLSLFSPGARVGVRGDLRAEVFSPQAPMDNSVCLPRGDRSGNGSNRCC